jgi:hypothetical protein
MQMNLYYIALVTSDLSATGKRIETAAYMSGPYPTHNIAAKNMPSIPNVALTIVEQVVEVQCSFG